MSNGESISSVYSENSSSSLPSEESSSESIEELEKSIESVGDDCDKTEERSESSEVSNDSMIVSDGEEEEEENEPERNVENLLVKKKRTRRVFTRICIPTEKKMKGKPDPVTVKKIFFSPQPHAPTEKEDEFTIYDVACLEVEYTDTHDEKEIVCSEYVLAFVVSVDKNQVVFSRLNKNATKVYAKKLAKAIYKGTDAQIFNTLNNSIKVLNNRLHPENNAGIIDDREYFRLIKNNEIDPIFNSNYIKGLSTFVDNPESVIEALREFHDGLISEGDHVDYFKMFSPDAKVKKHKDRKKTKKQKKSKSKNKSRSKSKESNDVIEDVTNSMLKKTIDISNSSNNKLLNPHKQRINSIKKIENNTTDDNAATNINNSKHTDGKAKRKIDEVKNTEKSQLKKQKTSKKGNNSKNENEKTPPSETKLLKKENFSKINDAQLAEFYSLFRRKIDKVFSNSNYKKDIKKSLTDNSIIALIEKTYNLRQITEDDFLIHNSNLLLFIIGFFKNQPTDKRNCNFKNDILEDIIKEMKKTFKNSADIITAINETNELIDSELVKLHNRRGNLIDLCFDHEREILYYVQKHNSFDFDMNSQNNIKTYYTANSLLNSYNKNRKDKKEDNTSVDSFFDAFINA